MALRNEALFVDKPISFFPLHADPTWVHKRKKHLFCPAAPIIIMETTSHADLTANALTGYSSAVPDKVDQTPSAIPPVFKQQDGYPDVSY